MFQPQQLCLSYKFNQLYCTTTDYILSPSNQKVQQKHEQTLDQNIQLGGPNPETVSNTPAGAEIGVAFVPQNLTPVNISPLGPIRTSEIYAKEEDKMFSLLEATNCAWFPLNSWAELWAVRDLEALEVPGF